MDRTMIWKAEERDASERLHKKFLALFLLHPPSETLRRILTDDMFLKPNVQGFFHVMHYVFWLLDPAEFKKRFYWPITDKRAEASFRSTTVEYLKHLSEKHHLQWNTSIKTYLVVMPGGMKFITFMLEFVGFVVRELTRRRERQLADETETDLSEVCESNVQRMRRRNAFHKVYAAEYLTQLTEQIKVLQTHKLELERRLGEIAQLSGVDAKQLAETDTFNTTFEAANRQLYREKITNPVTRIASLEQPLIKLKHTVERFLQKDHEVKRDPMVVQQALVKIRQRHPERMRGCKAANDDINMNNLLVAFNCIYNSLEDALSAAEQTPPTSEFVLTEFVALRADLQRAESQMAHFQKMLNINFTADKQAPQHRTPKRPEDGGATGVDQALRMTYIYTPTIKLNMQESGCSATARLPLLDNFNVGSDTTTLNAINHHMLAITRTARKARAAANQSFGPNSTLNKSKIIDSMQLLRTVKKNTSEKNRPAISQQSLSTLSLKWKERQCQLNEAKVDEEHILVTPLKASTTTDMLSAHSSQPSSPYTPFNSNERTCIVAHCQPLEETGSAAGSSMPFVRKKLAAVKKVQEASLNVHELNTSPSGRLDALVAGVINIKELPPPTLQLNDVALNQTLDAVPIIDYGGNGKSLNEDIATATDGGENNENDANAANVMLPRLLFGEMEENDDIQLANISDSVLQDIIM